MKLLVTGLILYLMSLKVRQRTLRNEISERETLKLYITAAPLEKNQYIFTIHITYKI